MFIGNEKNMVLGWVYCANSYVTLKSGQKFYLQNQLDEVEKKVRSKDRIIRLNISDLDETSIRVDKDSIKDYGIVDMSKTNNR